ncbi:MAG TPA: tetratricopeptide repeat protein [Vicinamibacterales bacterium]|jgi:TolA-binding protein
MVRTHIIGRTLTICAMVLGLAAFAAPASAQTGQVKGKITDAEGKPVEGAKVTIQLVDNNTKFELKTKKNGDFMQIGLQPGSYKITAEKDGLSASKTQRISLDMAEVNLTLTKGGMSTEGMSKEDRAKAEAKVAGVKAAYAEAAQLANAGKFDEAIAKFNEVLKDVPKCTECYIGIGHSNAGKKDYAASEAAFKEALKLDPNSADAYNGLATIYNDQKKFAEAKEMSAEAMKHMATAGGTGNADQLYNAGVISWNANDFAKAQEQFAAAIAANPNHAESHFMLGQCNLNLGKLPEAAKEFETYTKLAPNGPNAEKAKSNFEMLKAYIK